MDEQATMDFNGPAYEPDLDRARLTGQIRRVFRLMRDGEWRILAEISMDTGDPEASVSAQLRHLRKKRFGEHVVLRQRRGDPRSGLHEYRLIERMEKADG
jgi:hypothetical protein